jgi:hypothetical protein
MKRFTVVQVAVFLAGFCMSAEAGNLSVSQRSFDIGDRRLARVRHPDSKSLELAQAATPKGSMSSGEPGGAQHNAGSIGDTGGSWVYRAYKYMTGEPPQPSEDRLLRTEPLPEPPPRPHASAAASPETTKTK